MDSFNAMQLQFVLHQEVSLTEKLVLPALYQVVATLKNEWLFDLLRIYQSPSCSDRGDESGFDVYTWLLDHGNQACFTPKFTRLSSDQTAWEEEVKFPWRYHLNPDLQNIHVCGRTYATCCGH